MGNTNKAAELIDRTVRRSTNPPGRTLTNRFYVSVGKRVMDIIGAVLVFLFLWPLFLYIVAAIKRDSPGPVFYRGPRVGKDGKPFGILKFRTMYERAESYNGSRLTANEDERITPFGSWLRRTKINELPNFWNVLVGEMSFVGPRPEDPTFVENWPADVRQEILSVRPGITSPASVTYRDEQKLLAGTNILDEYLQNILPQKMRMDQLYVRHHNLMGDLDVIFMTFIYLIPGLDKKEVKESSLYHGPFKLFSDKYLSWFASDFLVAFLAISLATIIWRIQTPLDIGFGYMVLYAAGIAFALALTNTLFGLKDIDWRYASPTHVLDLTLSTFLAIGASVLFIALLIPEKSLPTVLAILFAMFSLIGFVGMRYRLRLFTGLASRWMRARSQSSILGERVLVIGAGDCAQLGIWLMEKSDLSTAFSIVGMVDDDFSRVNQKINGYPVLGTTNEIPDIIQRHSIGLVMFAINKVSSKDKERILSLCNQFPVKILMIPDLLNVVKDYFVQQARKVPQADE